MLLLFFHLGISVIWSMSLKSDGIDALCEQVEVSIIK